MAAEMLGYLQIMPSVLTGRVCVCVRMCVACACVWTCLCEHVCMYVAVCGVCLRVWTCLCEPMCVCTVWHVCGLCLRVDMPM